MSMSIKLMGVPGPKLLNDEKFTQDLFGTSVPTFISPDTRANAELQHWSLKNAQLFYFLNFRETHIMDGIMNLLWTKTQSSHGGYPRQAGRRVRHPRAAADRPVSDANREQRGDVAHEAVAASAGRRSADSEADLRLPGTARIRQGVVVQPLALHSRAPPAGQREPGQEAPALRVVQIAAKDE